MNLEKQADILLGITKKRKKQINRQKKIPRMSYSLYMGSAYWKKRKNDYFGKYGKKCSVCGVKNGITIHHKRYDHKLYGREPDDMLIALCMKHHHEFHECFGVQKNMHKNTKKYIVHAKQFNVFEQEASWLSTL